MRALMPLGRGLSITNPCPNTNPPPHQRIEADLHQRQQSGKRVAVIHGAGRLFGCRGCKGLAYTSQSEADDDRAARRADRLRKRLGWQPGILNGPDLKVKGMHQSTYMRLLAQHDAFVGLSLAGMAKKLGLLQAGLERIEADAASWR